ncbi:MAG: hypothetical protein Tp178MES00d2C33159091_56 [Prokaryotic dsDNA virus sp.]|uniref:hypothetical protein n=1 Tax=Thalassospira sp. TaxID=1912094 RepID=UPI000C5D0E4C|nr:hypothetical protein [Thalassospira sp.]QDP61005.1 MAG: hypothetical protein Tp178MES00d2C33159091_56 [Prokaryotic dsDNA virus sp.]MAZ33868.1 hypothetical protein [Thalassospira sp.]MAZ33924.1 hypothetical protein [Thalassospira sp.]MAZ34639.1 hypothetical protein [Thalassospira sp.]QDP64490.1 MAG: hypothetical protein Tp178SUR1139111_10 [Prokaryotic dsDNA virus sp.]|tara:strand:- start:607 stop:1236 length:630 start_codon:yes stop_codon:yes gene_type:complete
MSVLAVFMWVIGLLVAYVLVAKLTYAALDGLGFCQTCDDETQSIMASVFWPVGIPVIVSLQLLKGIGHLLTPTKWLKLFSKLRGKRDDEIIPGVTKPSIIAADMLVAQMIQNPREVKNLSFSTSKVSLRWRDGLYPSYQVRNFILSVPGKTEIRFEGEAEQRLIKGLKKAKTLRDEMLKADELAKREQEALDVIEALTIGNTSNEQEKD